MTVIPLTVNEINYSDIKKSVESMVAEKKPGRGADQFPLRFPEGMRDEIKRLADEDGQSMNTKIIELLTFATENSGLDIDELLQVLVTQRQEIGRYRKLIDRDRTFASDALWHVLAYIDDIPPELTLWVDNMLRILDPESDYEDTNDPVLERPHLPEHKKEVERRVEGIRERYTKHTDEAVARILKSRGIDPAPLMSKLTPKT